MYNSYINHTIENIYLHHTVFMLCPITNAHHKLLNEELLEANSVKSGVQKVFVFIIYIYTHRPLY